jgi:hypothetical protein
VCGRTREKEGIERPLPWWREGGKMGIERELLALGLRTGELAGPNGPAWLRWAGLEGGLACCCYEAGPADVPLSLLSFPLTENSKERKKGRKGVEK